MVTEAKSKAVEELKAIFAESTSAVMADYRGVNGNDITQLRKELREADAKFKVVKNTLVKLAVKDTPYEPAEQMFEGPVSVTFGFGDEIGKPAKALLNFAKQNENLKIIGGMVEGSVLDKAGVKKLADMPPKPVVQAMLLGLLQSPARNLLGVLEGAPRKLLYALHAIAQEKEKE